MSKIGKKNIVIPKDSSIAVASGQLTIKGPKGSKILTINDKIFSSSIKENNQFEIKPLSNDLLSLLSVRYL